MSSGTTEATAGATEATSAETTATAGIIPGLFALVTVDTDGSEMIVAMRPAPGQQPTAMITDNPERATAWAARCQSFADSTKKTVRLLGFVRAEEPVLSCEPQTIITEEPKLIIP